MVVSSYTTGMDFLQLKISSYMLMFISISRKKQEMSCVCMCVRVCCTFFFLCLL